MDPTGLPACSRFSSNDVAVIVDFSAETLVKNTRIAQLSVHIRAQKWLSTTVFQADRITLKVGFHYPSSRAEFTGRVDGPRTRVHFLTPVNSGRELG